MSRFPTPLQLELSWKRSEKRLVKWLARRHILFFVCAGLLLVLPPIFLIKLGHHVHFSKAGGMVVVKLARFALRPAILLSLPALVFGWASRQAWRTLCFLIVCLYSTFRIYHLAEYSPAFFLAVAMVPLLCGLSYLAIKYIDVNKRGSGLLVVTYCASSLSLIFVSSAALFYQHIHHLPRLQWILAPTLIVLSTLALLTVRTRKISAAQFSTSLIHSLRGIPWPLEAELITDDREELRRLWWLGALNMAQGYLQIFMRILIDNFLLVPVHRTYGRQALFSLLFYVVVMLTNVGYLNILSGTLRMNGFRVPDATDFKWLARTPGEFWRRGNVYLYQYILRFIYFPSVRLFKNPAISATVAFNCLLIFKVGWLGILHMSFLLFGFAGLPNHLVRPRRIYAMLIRWVLWLTILNISRRWWFFRSAKTADGRVAWASILLTHVAMWFVFYLSFQIL